MSDTLQKLQALDQNLQMLRTQVHSTKSTLLQTTTALKSLDGNEEAFTFVGNIMIKRSVVELTTELTDKKNVVEKKLNSLVEQESQLVATKTELETVLLGDQK